MCSFHEKQKKNSVGARERKHAPLLFREMFFQGNVGTKERRRLLIFIRRWYTLDILGVHRNVLSHVVFVIRSCASMHKIWVYDTRGYDSIVIIQRETCLPPGFLPLVLFFSLFYTRWKYIDSRDQRATHAARDLIFVYDDLYIFARSGLKTIEIYS